MKTIDKINGGKIMTNLKKCMKKILAISLAALMLGGSVVTVLPEVAQSGILASAVDEGITDDGFGWQENEDGGVTITKYTGEGKNVVVPNEIDGKTVTEIGNNAFEFNSRLTSVTIESGVTSIGEFAFNNCTGLTNVSIPDSVTSIGEWAFSDCKGLTSVSIPDSVTSIGCSAFGGCTALTSISVSADNGYYSSDNGVLLDKLQ